MQLITFCNVSKKLMGRPVLRDISLEVMESEILVIMGPSGCGKTTLLKMMAGDVPADQGVITHWTPGYREQTGFILQRLNVFPWLTVKDNVGFGLNGDPAHKTHEIGEMIQMLGLEEFADYYPAQLSGGMLQRVAIGRTLILQPKLILMDEPFTGLDYARRKELHHVVRKLQQQMKTAVVLVTHDIEDAVRLGNRIMVLSERPGSTRLTYDNVQRMDDSQKLNLAREFIEG
jgi:ABC-type nitrate/sulfonate/bicarbonate transport system ATPase subunit